MSSCTWLQCSNTGIPGPVPDVDFTVRCRELKTAGFLAIGPVGLMAGGPEDHCTDGREVYLLVEGYDWAHMEALIPTPVTGPAGLRSSSTGGRGARKR